MRRASLPPSSENMLASSAATAPNRESADVKFDVDNIASAKAIGVSDLPTIQDIDPDGTYMIRAAPPGLLLQEPLQATEVTKPSRLQALYLPHFQRLDRKLEALKESMIVQAREKSKIVQAGEGIVARSVTTGLVPGLGVDVEAKGKLVFRSKLVKHEARPTK